MLFEHIAGQRLPSVADRMEGFPVADAVAHLRSEAISLIYDPVARSLTSDTPRAERITIG
ncbi:hypothetical protein KN815_32480 [Streptomyces sp. 4503]|uniref:Uncharacterized protein n=1 Tax=Streptomyces niphimycinicus TaxID=2842201 RepID=A0ABS6CNS9_9ACTN|nr:hypothetical protein [Streptomyces niphimycinicus]MBU3868598.1 hypothetical protein [Streptomyces niphimycinicus]